MKVYLVRHGESMLSNEGRHQNSKTPLSKLGKNQARTLANRLKKIHIDFIYVNPEARARETVEIISKTLNLPVKYIPELKEHKKPTSIEGEKQDSELSQKFDKLVEKYWSDPEWKCEDGESLQEAWARIQEIMDYLIKNHENQDILVVAHGIVIRYFLTLALFGDKLDPKIAYAIQCNVYIHHTGISLLEYGSNFGWRLVYWNDFSHMGSLKNSTY